MKKNNGSASSQQVAVADALIHYLTLEGVDTLFGIPGGGLAIMLTALKDQRERLRYVICRQETGAAYVADGYARLSGGLGVVMVTSGPGATNALTGTMNADNDGTPMLTITGEVDQQFYGKGYLQEGTDARLDVNRVFAASTDYSVGIAAASDMPTLTEQALRIARGLPGRAVHLSLPNNVSAQTLDPSRLPRSTSSYRTRPAGVDAAQAQTLLDALLQAERPCLFLGNGCREAMRDPQRRRTLIEFVERFQIPVMTTADGKGVFPESHPLSLRVYGFANCMWPQYWLKPQRLDPTAPPSFDALLIVGSQLAGLGTNKWDPMLIPDGPMLQVDVDPGVIGRGFPLTQGVVGEAGALFDVLHALGLQVTPDKLKVEHRREFMRRIKQEKSPFFDPEQYLSDAAPIRPAAMIRVIQQALSEDTVIMLDAGNCVGWGVHYLCMDMPQEVHSSLAMGPMGFGVGSVVGAKLARPDSPCLAIVGDGAFLMHGAEVSTAQAHGVGAIWLVLEDRELNMVVQGQAHFFPDKNDPGIWKQLYALGEPDLVGFAQGLGADACRVTDTAALAEALSRALTAAASGKPQVIVVGIDARPLPPYYNPQYATGN